MKYFITLLITIALFGCANVSNNNKLDDITVAQNINQNFIYKLGAGDKIRVNVYQEEDLSGKFEIDSRGMISLPYIQDIKASGLSAKELSNSIEQTFTAKNILKDPKVSIEILNYRPFYIQGEVNKGGEYPYKANMDIRNAVATAGGYTYRADQNIVHVRREGNGKVLKIDISSANFPIYPGDNIEIPERFF